MPRSLPSRPSSQRRRTQHWRKRFATFRRTRNLRCALGTMLKCIGKLFPEEKTEVKKTSSTLQEGLKAQYFFTTIKRIELVSLPEKQVVADLPWDGSAVGMSLTWSPDSKWCAFYANMSRTSETTVYHLRGDKFVEMGGEEELGVDVKGDVRFVWVTPIRWIKPGVLLLEQHVTNGKNATYSFTAKFDEKTGKFQIISKKKGPSKE